MHKIHKKDMAARAVAAAASTPNLEDRFAHARAASGNNPAARQEPISDEAQTLAPGSHASGSSAPAAASDAASPATQINEVLREVALDLIDPNPFNARKIYRAKRITELAASIGANGQDQPGIATMRNGRYILVAGHYRLKALAMLRNRPMMLLVRPDLTDCQLYEMSFRENQEREDQTTLDNALAWKELLEKRVYGTEAELAEAIGFSAPSITKTMAILRMKEQVLDIIRDDPSKFGISVAYELALFSDVAPLEETLEIAKGVIAEEVSRKSIQDARQRFAKPQNPRKTKEIARTYKISREGSDIGSLKTWDSGKVALEVTIADQSVRHELIAELQRRFGLTE